MKVESSPLSKSEYVNKLHRQTFTSICCQWKQFWERWKSWWWRYWWNKWDSSDIRHLSFIWNHLSRFGSICPSSDCEWNMVVDEKTLLFNAVFENIWRKPISEFNQSQTWIFLQSCISPAIYHHFQFKATVLAPKKKSLNNWTLGCWVDTTRPRHVQYHVFSKYNQFRVQMK